MILLKFKQICLNQTLICLNLRKTKNKQFLSKMKCLFQETAAPDRLAENKAGFVQFGQRFRFKQSWIRRVERCEIWRLGELQFRYVLLHGGPPFIADFLLSVFRRGRVG